MNISDWKGTLHHLLGTVGAQGPPTTEILFRGCVGKPRREHHRKKKHTESCGQSAGTAGDDTWFGPFGSELPREPSTEPDMGGPLGGASIIVHSASVVHIHPFPSTISSSQCSKSLLQSSLKPTLAVEIVENLRNG